MNDEFQLQDWLEERLIPLPEIKNLPPGATLLGFRVLQEPFLLKILCHLAGNTCPFVMWTYNRTTGGCAFGHYHMTLKGAEKAFLSVPDFS